MQPARLIVLSGVLLVSDPSQAAVIHEEARQAMENQALEFQVDDADLALSRAEEWLAETGHLPMPFGVTYLIHRHKGPEVKKGKLVSRCSLSGNAPPRRPDLQAAENPVVNRDTLGPATSADRQAIAERIAWQFRVEVDSEGNRIRITPAKGSNREMVSILARYVQSGSPACRRELTWLIDRPGYDPVAFDPTVHRYDPPTVDYRTCFLPPD